MLYIMMMTLMSDQQVDTYWEIGNIDSFWLSRVNYGQFVQLKRFKEIKKWHVFIRPSDAM